MKRGIPIGEGTYDLTIQAPSLAVKTEEGVHGSFETYTTESGSYVTKSAKAEAKEVTIPKRKYKPEGTATTQNPPSKKMKKALGPAYVAKNSVQPGSQRHIRRGAHSTPEIIIINTDEFLSMASAASKSMLNDLFDILGIESDLLHATLSGRQAAAADCKAKAHAADDPFLPRPGQQRWSSTKRVLPRMSPLPLASELSCRSIVSGSTSLRESTPLTETSTAPRLVDSLPSRPARPTGSASLKINRQQAAGISSSELPSPYMFGTKLNYD